MKRSLTALAALVATAGLAVVAQAQTLQTQTTVPMPSQDATNPHIQSNAMPAQPPGVPGQTMAQQSGVNDFWTRPLTREQVREAQQRLQGMGLYNGAADGLMGSSTHRAIAQFQQRNGLPQTATLDEGTVSRLIGGTTMNIGAGTPPAGTIAPLGAGSDNCVGPNCLNPAQPIQR
jgi:peptidoglycan hydrolase-like protein with peptidoglycan-binding domain